jgi:hypothetical protein
MATAYALFALPSSVDSATVFAFVQDHLAAGFTNSGGGSGGEAFGANHQLQRVALIS